MTKTAEEIKLDYNNLNPNGSLFEVDYILREWWLELVQHHSAKLTLDVWTFFQMKIHEQLRATQHVPLRKP